MNRIQIIIQAPHGMDEWTEGPLGLLGCTDRVNLVYHLKYIKAVTWWYFLFSSFLQKKTQAPNNEVIFAHDKIPGNKNIEFILWDL